MSLVWLFCLVTLIRVRCVLFWCAWGLCIVITAPFLVQVQVWLVGCEAFPLMRGWRKGDLFILSL